jgi:hypothetical protein
MVHVRTDPLMANTIAMCDEHHVVPKCFCTERAGDVYKHTGATKGVRAVKQVITLM